MEPRSLFLYTVRGIVMFMTWSLSQLPASWDVQLDVDQVMNAVTMREGDSRVSAGPWPEAPTLEQLRGSSSTTPASSSFEDDPEESSPRSGTRDRASIFKRFAEYAMRMWKATPANSDHAKHAHSMLIILFHNFQCSLYSFCSCRRGARRRGTFGGRRYVRRRKYRSLEHSKPKRC